MEYLYGNEENFWNFVDSITSEDKIALLTHTDLDGISSGIFLEEILKSKNLNAELIRFLGIKPSMFEEISLTLEKEKINFVFITDIVADLIKGFREFCGKFNVFLIDHHPSNFENGGYKNILKSESADCVGEVMFNLGKQVINPEWGIPLVCATMVAEFSFKKKENLEFIQHYYPEAIEENIFESVPGVLSKKIAAALIYYSSNLRKVYDIIKERNFEELDEAYGVIETEIQKNIELFGEDAECYSEKNLCFYLVKSEYNITSIVCSIVSSKDPEKTFIFLSHSLSEPGILKISARNQSGVRDVSVLLKNSVKNLENALGGGHARASGGRIMKKDLEKFKKNILDEIK